MTDFTFPLKYAIPNRALVYDYIDSIPYPSASYIFNSSSVNVIKPLFDTSKVTDMSNMFYYCNNLVGVPLFDTSNVTDMSNMFTSCSKLRTIPQFDTSKVTDMSYMLGGCSMIADVPELDCSSCININNFFGSGSLSSLNRFGGWKNYGMQSNATSVTNGLNRVQNLDKESLLNVFNGLYDRASAGYSVLTLKMHADHLAMLSDEEKAIATNKGWTLS